MEEQWSGPVTTPLKLLRDISPPARRLLAEGVAVKATAIFDASGLEARVVREHVEYRCQVLWARLVVRTSQHTAGRSTEEVVRRAQEA